MSKLIKIHDNIYNNLAEEKQGNETFSEVIARLLRAFRILKETGAILQKPSPEATSPKSGREKEQDNEPIPVEPVSQG